MPGYLKNLSAFRMLFLFLLALSAGQHLVSARREAGRREAVAAPADVYAAVLESAEHFGNRLSAIESVAISLATQAELVAPRRETANFHDALQHVLDSAPPYILGVALSLGPTESEARQVIYLHRDEWRTMPMAEAGGADDDDLPHTPREINLERTLHWRLLTGPQDAAGSRLNASLAVSLAGQGGRRGKAMTRADLGWLADILRRLGAARGIDAICVTPEREYVWTDGGVMRSNLDFQPGAPDFPRAVEQAMKQIETGAGARFVKADIMGTGWLLLAGAREHEDREMPLALLIALLSAGALVVEATVSALRESGGKATRPAPAPPPVRRSSRRRRGIAERTRSLLFNYRLANPDQERIDSELKVARDIQLSLVPASFPPYSAWREFDLHAHFAPVREIGGDYYDFFMLNPDTLVIVVGDVSGKGVPAALYMAVTRTAFRTLARKAVDPARLMRDLNEMLVRDNHSGLYVTLVCFFINLADGEAEYVIAGHPAPVLRRAAEKGTEIVDTPRETFVGMQSELVFPLGRLTLRKGDTLLLYTDGVTEAADAGGRQLDYAGLSELFAEAAERDTCRAVIEALDEKLSSFARDGEQTDDVTLLAFRYWGPGGKKGGDDDSSTTPTTTQG